MEKTGHIQAGSGGFNTGQCAQQNRCGHGGEKNLALSAMKRQVSSTKPDILMTELPRVIFIYP